MCKKTVLIIMSSNSGEGEPGSDYPDIVSISNRDPSENYDSSAESCLGQYSKIAGESSLGRPVWKHKNRKDRFFFFGLNSWWHCGYLYGPKRGGFFSAALNKGNWTIEKNGPQNFIIEGMKRICVCPYEPISLQDWLQW